MYFTEIFEGSLVNNTYLFINLYGDDFVPGVVSQLSGFPD